MIRIKKTGGKLMAVCLNHTDTEAVTRCAACGKPLCADCIAVTDGADYCSESCCTRGKAAAARSGEVISEKSSAGRSKAVRFLIVLFLIIAVAAAGFMYYKQNKKEVDRSLNKTIRQTKAAAGKAGAAVTRESKNIKKTLDTDSKYKRDREALVK